MDLDFQFKFWANIINLVLGIITTIGGALTLFFILKLKLSLINKLLILLNLCLFLFLPIANIIYSLHHTKIISNEPSQIVHLSMALGGHMLRFGVLTIVIERLFATIYWRTYQIRPKFQTSVALSLSAMGIGLALFLTLITSFFRIDMLIRNVPIISTHLGSLFVTLFLIRKNKQLRNLSRLRPLLLQRYQLSQNLKNLQLLQPYIFILATLGPITPIIYVILYLVDGSTTDVSIPILYSLYDMSLIICQSIFLYSIFKTNYKFSKERVSPFSTNVKEQQHVQTALGTYIPTLLTVEDYFVQLKNTWM